MKKVLLAAAALACFGGTALAGPNANGSLILALADGVEYTSDNTGYCGATGLQSCADAIARVDRPAEDGTVSVIGVLGAFPSVSNPRVLGVTFGWTYDADITIAEAAACGDFELPTAAWPNSGEGTAVTWGAAQTGTLLDIYWVAAYNYYGTATSINLGAHPTQGSDFADDSIPSILDPVAAHGSFGFNTDGNVPCPPDVAPGACCFADGSCTVVLREECDGVFQGDGTVCDPNPCDQPAVGACCVGEVCSIRTADECTDAGGQYQGDDSGCDPDPCGPIPTFQSSWGAVKNIYR